MKKKYVKPKIKFYLQSKDELDAICCEKHGNSQDLHYNTDYISFEIKQDNDSLDVMEDMLCLSLNKA